MGNLIRWHPGAPAPSVGLSQEKSVYPLNLRETGRGESDYPRPGAPILTVMQKKGVYQLVKSDTPFFRLVALPWERRYQL